MNQIPADLLESLATMSTSRNILWKQQTPHGVWPLHVPHKSDEEYHDHIDRGQS